MAGETVVGQGNECIFRHHGIKLRSKTEVLDGVEIASRCIRYEQNTIDFGLSDSENLCSKIYLLRVENSDTMFKVKVTLPVFQGAKEDEELFMKTDSGKEAKVSKTKRSKRNGWFATFRCKLHKEVTFVVVCRMLDLDKQPLECARGQCGAADDTDSCLDTSRSSSRSLYSTATHEEYDVVFLVMSKLSENDGGACEVIVDCSGVLKAAINRTYWEKKGFQKELQSVVCKTLAKQTFNIFAPSTGKEGNIESNAKELITLQFHPLRPNFVKLMFVCKQNTLRKILSKIEIRKQLSDVNVSIKEDHNETTSSIVMLTLSEEKETFRKETCDQEILCPSNEFQNETKNSESERLQSNDFRIEKVSSEQEPSLITDELSVHENDADVTEKEIVSTRKFQTDVKDEQTKDWIQREFLNDTLLTCLQEKFEASWLDILILIGTPFNVIEKELLAMRDTTTEDKVRQKLFQQWRDQTSHQADKGVPQLLSAFLKCSKIDCSHFLRLAIKDWRNQEVVRGDPLYLWLERAYADQDMFTPINYPRPMSDQYLVLVCAGLIPTADLASKLNISEEGYSRIVENPSFPDDTTKLMKLFTLFRDKANSKESALVGLLDALKRLEYGEQCSRGIACASGWLNRHAGEKDELRIPVQKLLEEANATNQRPKTFERRWARIKRSITGLQFSRQKSLQASRASDPSTSVRSQLHQGFFG